MARSSADAPRIEPAYLRLLASGELDERARIASSHLECCDLCARYCRVNRKVSVRGAVCRTGERARVDSAFPHYADPELARRYSHVRDYAAVNRAAVREMHRQVGDLVIDADGIARCGLLVRHLVLPNGISGTDEVLRFIAEEISPDTY